MFGRDRISHRPVNSFFRDVAVVVGEHGG